MRKLLLVLTILSFPSLLFAEDSERARTKQAPLSVPVGNPVFPISEEGLSYSIEEAKRDCAAKPSASTRRATENRFEGNWMVIGFRCHDGKKIVDSHEKGFIRISGDEFFENNEMIKDLSDEEVTSSHIVKSEKGIIVCGLRPTFYKLETQKGQELMIAEPHLNGIAGCQGRANTVYKRIPTM